MKMQKIDLHGLLNESPILVYANFGNIYLLSITKIYFLKMRYITLFTLWLTGFAATAQKNFTIEEAVMGSRSTLAPKKLVQLQFTKTEGQLSHVEETDTASWLVITDKSGARSTVLTLK